MTFAVLKDLARQAHANGIGWITFRWEHAAAIHRLCPGDAVAYGKAVGMLLHIVCTGEEAGMRPPPVAGDDEMMPWERDDAAAKFQGRLFDNSLEYS